MNTYITLAEKLSASGVSTDVLDLNDVVDAHRLWFFPQGWDVITHESLPTESLVSANVAETVDGQTSVTVSSAWALSGLVRPLELLTGFTDPVPEGAELVSSWQDGPTSTWYGAGVTSHMKYRVAGLELTGFTRFDVLVSPSFAGQGGGVLLQRTYNSPCGTAVPECVDPSTQVVDALLANAERE